MGGGLQPISSTAALKREVYTQKLKKRFTKHAKTKLEDQKHDKYSNLNVFTKNSKKIVLRTDNTPLMW